MAAIEKICEYSGDYPGWLMYSYKHNHIQIIPKYRKDFRGKKAVLFIETSENILGRYFVRNSRGYGAWHMSKAEVKDRIWKCGSKNYDDDQNYVGRSWYPVRIHTDYWYALVVPDMQGEVNGIYTNNSCDLSSVKRKLKRMLRCRKLEVRFIDELKTLRTMDQSELRELVV
jgi:hypothetical protein